MKTNFVLLGALALVFCAGASTLDGGSDLPNAGEHLALIPDGTGHGDPTHPLALVEDGTGHGNPRNHLALVEDGTGHGNGPKHV